MTKNLPRNGLLTIIILNVVVMSAMSSAGSILTEKCTSIENPLFDSTLKLNYDPPSPELNGTMGENGIFISNVTVSFNVSGFKALYYSVDSGAWNLYIEPFIIPDQGVILLRWYVVDEGGNQSSILYLDILIDYTEPVVEILNPRIGSVYLLGEELFKNGNFNPLIIGKITIETLALDQHFEIDHINFSLINRKGNQENYNSGLSGRWELTGIHIGKYTLKVIAYDSAGLSARPLIEMIIIQFR